MDHAQVCSSHVQDSGKYRHFSSSLTGLKGKSNAVFGVGISQFPVQRLA
jgi:hypothetical protein